MSWFWPFINSLLHLQKKTVQGKCKVYIWLNPSLLCPPLHDPQVQTFICGSHSARGYTRKICTTVMPRSADVRYGPTVLSNDTVERRSRSEEHPLSPTSSNMYYIFQGVAFWFCFVCLSVFKVAKLGDRDKQWLVKSTVSPQVWRTSAWKSGQEVMYLGTVTALQVSYSAVTQVGPEGISF